MNGTVRGRLLPFVLAPVVQTLSVQLSPSPGLLSSVETLQVVLHSEGRTHSVRVSMHYAMIVPFAPMSDLYYIRKELEYYACLHKVCSFKKTPNIHDQ